MTYEEALRFAYRKLSIRGYHTVELTNKLSENGASSEIIAKVVGELQRLGYLNDEEWVAGAVRSLSARKYGPRAIAFKLAAKGIPEEEIDSHIEGVSDLQQEQVLRLLATRYKSRNLADYKERQKVIAALVRKGYDLQTVINVLKCDNT